MASSRKNAATGRIPDRGISLALIDAIAAWRLAQPVPNKTQALIYLVERGLAATRPDRVPEK
jgi:hypothetical protein